MNQIDHHPSSQFSEFHTSVKLQQGLIQSFSVEDLIQELLIRLGENPEREGLKKTPERVTNMYSEILAGYNADLKSLINGAIFKTADQDMVIIKNIQFYSLCEHHLLPFFGKAHVAYIPNGEIIGLSKIPRIVEMFARRLQVQERMTHQIAETLDEVLHPLGVAVLLEGSHLCAHMRGVRQNDVCLTTRCMLGAFESDKDLRYDFISQLK